jgi:hypothetical protein
MARAAEPLFCHTCGTFIRPGTHGIHAPRYGEGPQGSYEDETVSGVQAVMSVVLAIAGLGILFLVAAMLVARMR